MPDYEASETNSVTVAVKAAIVKKLYVEFLQQGSPKPHVVFRLNIQPVRVSSTTWRGCRLAMNSVAGTDGVLHLTPLTYASSSNAAHAAFEFRLKQTNWTVNNVLGAILTPHDLSSFSFADGFRVAGSVTEYLDGCRDFM
jgi:hypothetical protein